MVGPEPAQDPVRCRKLCTSVPTAIMLPPTLSQRRRWPDAPRKRTDRVIISTSYQHLVEHAVGLPNRLERRRLQFSQSVGAGLLGGSLQLPLGPADKIRTGNVANEQVQRIGGLVEPSMAQPMSGRG